MLRSNKLRALIISFLFLSSLGVFANVGSVDSQYGRKAAACTNSQESSDKAVSRDVNPGNVLANLVNEVEKRDKSPTNKTPGTGGVVD